MGLFVMVEEDSLQRGFRLRDAQADNPGETMIFKLIKAIKLNKQAAEQADAVLEALAIQPGMTIADIGSGGGYFVFRFSDLVGPNGKVYAVDVDKTFLYIITKEMRRRKLNNIEPLKSGPNGGSLPYESCDLIFVRNVFHHFLNAQTYMRLLRPALRQGGRIALIDWLPEAEKTHGIKHGTDPDLIKETCGKAGLKHVAEFDFLPSQSFNIFAGRQPTNVMPAKPQPSAAAI